MKSFERPLKAIDWRQENILRVRVYDEFRMAIT